MVQFQGSTSRKWWSALAEERSSLSVGLDGRLAAGDFAQKRELPPSVVMRIGGPESVMVSTSERNFASHNHWAIAPFCYDRHDLKLIRQIQEN